MIRKLLPILLVLLISCQAACFIEKWMTQDTQHPPEKRGEAKLDLPAEDLEQSAGDYWPQKSKLRLWSWVSNAKRIHPLVIAGMQLLVIIGVSILLTDNRELELYFKIDFNPPKTDILR
jgi:hypothetical protein